MRLYYIIPVFIFVVLLTLMYASRNQDGEEFYRFNISIKFINNDDEINNTKANIMNNKDFINGNDDDTLNFEEGIDIENGTTILVSSAYSDDDHDESQHQNKFRTIYISTIITCLFLNVLLIFIVTYKLIRGTF